VENKHPWELSFKTRDKFEEEGIGSCYYCCRTVKPDEVAEYTDRGQTVVCPFCFVDSVIPGDIPKEQLKAWREEGFGVQED
jgi:hypothetical protein